MEEAVGEHEVGEVPGAVDETLLGDAGYIGGWDSAGECGPALGFAGPAERIEGAVEQAGKSAHESVSGVRADDGEDDGEQAAVGVGQGDNEPGNDGS
jgi:hypothetical protein